MFTLVLLEIANLKYSHEAGNIIPVIQFRELGFLNIKWSSFCASYGYIIHKCLKNMQDEDRKFSLQFRMKVRYILQVEYVQKLVIIL